MIKKHQKCRLYLTLLLFAFPEISSAIDKGALSLWGEKVPFSINITGDSQLKSQLEEEIRKQRKSAPLFDPTISRRKIARSETGTLRTLLESLGYYNHKVGAAVEDNEITYSVATGSVFEIVEVTLQAADYINLDVETLPISEGLPLRASTILDTKKFLHNYVEDNYCLFRVETHYNVWIDKEQNSAKVHYNLVDSPSVNFGKISFSGLTSIEEEYLRNSIDLSTGQCFKRKSIDEVRIALLQSNLIARVDVTISKPKNLNEQLEKESDLNFHIVERNHRTIRAGIGYESNEGAGISLGWTHRNVSGKAEKLDIDTYFAERAQSASSSITIPHFKRKNQQITFYSEYDRENTDAFVSSDGSVGAEIARPLRRNLRLRLGGDFTYSEVEEDQSKESFALISSPITLEFDRRENPLNPTRGWVAAATMRPYWDASDSDTRFVKSTIAASAYYTLEDIKYTPTLALRAATGTISGIEREKVPANIRYYVGGGGSVRGYPFQSLGPSIENGKGGGLSFTEISFETRFRPTEQFGYVLFVDGGLAFKESSPQIDEELLWSAGFGFRYFTGFVPIRIDFAFPLDQRKDTDDSFEFYISIGQAF